MLLTPEKPQLEMVKMLQKPVFVLPGCQPISVNTFCVVLWGWLKHLLRTLFSSVDFSKDFKPSGCLPFGPFRCLPRTPSMLHVRSAIEHHRLQPPIPPYPEKKRVQENYLGEPHTTTS